MSCRSEVFLSKNDLGKTKLDGRKYNARHKAGLDGVQEECSFPRCYFRNRFRVIRASGTEAFPPCLVASEHHTSALLEVSTNRKIICVKRQSPASSSLQ